MAEIVNLNKVRKERAKAVKAALAKQNRLAFGRTKSVKSLAEQQTTIGVSRLDGHRLEDPERP